LTVAGVVRTNFLGDMSDDEIQHCLSDQFISKACELLSKKDEKPVPLLIIFLMFEVCMLPTLV